ncbi:hypothetical protein AAG570_002958 [Ranatra chinensis]|uniref:ADP-ribosyl cyclase/cyclic ADP-ribose hydrolase n=1 Tax=Ranatra chinensis TaxID=642074 RepID=A0ABD0Y608_9HEMI
MIQRACRADNGEEAFRLLEDTQEVLKKAWAVPRHGRAIASTLCDSLRVGGAVDLLVDNCSLDREQGFRSAKLLEQCMTDENRDHVVKRGLGGVVSAACSLAKNSEEADHCRVGTRLLENLFQHNETTCSEMIRLGGLDTLIKECKNKDVETLRHCAGALANLSLYGGAENQEAMIKRKAPFWLYYLAFQDDQLMKYYALIAIAVLVNNSEIEAAVEQSEALEMINRFVTSSDPVEFADNVKGPSQVGWLKKLLPVLSSPREEAMSIATFHFCVDAAVRNREEGEAGRRIFREMGAVEALKRVAACPNAIASKFAAQALRLVGEEAPRKLTQQVPLWNFDDVVTWISQIGFGEFAENFATSRVDGDLLLQLTEENLRNDIGIKNGILLKRFTRELHHLKRKGDFSSRDTGNLNGFLRSIKPEFTVYTYQMLQAGVRECFLSSLTVHLQIRGFSVFLDVERLEAGKFDNNLLKNIRQAKNFLLVLTPDSLERCKIDTERKDWIHREVVAALESRCNIIPIMDNFDWPEPDDLPEDMRAVCTFNGVKWIHDYQEACVQKLERFLQNNTNEWTSVSCPKVGHRERTPPENLNLSTPPLTPFPKLEQSPVEEVPAKPPTTMSAPATPLISPNLPDITFSDKRYRRNNNRLEGAKRNSFIDKVKRTLYQKN